MILLDTNILSELMRPAPDNGVVQWLDAQVAANIWISAVTVSEIRLGIAMMPDGKRKERLGELAEAMFQEDFSNNCLPFDCSATKTYASIVSARIRQGRPISVEDAQIAAICRTGGLKLATRNTGDFEGIDKIMLVNPWEAR